MPYYRKNRAPGRTYRRNIVSGKWDTKKMASAVTRRVYSYKRNKTGYIQLMRRLPEITVWNSAVNTPTLIDSTSSVQIGNILASQGFNANVYDIPFSIQFKLSSILNSNDITTLCDKYRIKGAYIRVYYNNSNSSTGSMGGMPFIYYSTDHDDSTVPTVAQVREKMGVKMKTFKNASSYIGIKVRPTVTKEVYASALFTGYEVTNKPTWLDCNNPDILHFGVKGVISQMYLPAPASASSNLKFDIALLVEGKDFQ